MNTYKENFSKYESAYLLQRRALGDELSDEAHTAIEEIFAERGEILPPRPSKPILIAHSEQTSSQSGTYLRRVAVLFLAVVAMAVGKALAHTWVGVFVSLLLVGYTVIDWLRKLSLTPEQQQDEAMVRKAEAEGLSELMLAAAAGNLGRVKELCNYGVDVNAKSNVGTTALMYAARNNNFAVVQFLVSAKADPHCKSDKGATALSLAKKYGNHELVSYLERLGC